VQSQQKNLWKTIGFEERFDVISHLEKGEWNVDICHNVRFTNIRVHTIHDHAVRITESAKSGTKAFV